MTTNLVDDSTTCSLESLDCLLSATNSNTDNSVEDDGISLIFSDCRKQHQQLWNFKANNNSTATAAAISSGESESSQASSEQKKKLTRLNKRTITDQNNKNGQFYYLPEQPDRFRLISDDDINTNNNQSKLKRAKCYPTSSNINFQQPSSTLSSEPDPEAIAQMKEMIYRAAAFRPVNLGVEVVEKPKRKNVRISTDPQTVAARQRREKISERIRVLQRIVPGGNKMDTASMLEEAANYLKFLKNQVKALESLGHKFDPINTCSTSLTAFSSLPFNHNIAASTFPMQNHLSLQNPSNPKPI